MFPGHYRDKLFQSLLRNKTDKEAERVKFDREWTNSLKRQACDIGFSILFETCYKSQI